MIQLDPNLFLSYSVIGNTIQFNLRGLFNGWMGIGFDRTGYIHTQTDTIVCWILSSGTTVIQDGFSTSVSKPISDAQQSIQLVSSTRIGNTMDVSFSRLLNTGDSNDVGITLGQPITMGWAYHDSVFPNSVSIDAPYIEHNHRGNRQITFRNTPSRSPSSRQPSQPTTPIPPTTRLPSTPPVSSVTPVTPTPTVTPPQTLNDFYVTWKKHTDSIDFYMNSKASGWLSIGFDPTQRIHAATDTYIAWVLSSGQGVLIDGFSDTQSTPIVDNLQSATILNCTQDSEWLRFAFSRPLQTNDTRDMELKDQTVLMGWAYHTSLHPTTSSIAGISKHTNTGAMYVNLWTGETTEYSTPTHPNVYYISSLLGFLVFYAMIHWSCKVYKLSTKSATSLKVSVSGQHNIFYSWLHSRVSTVSIFQILLLAVLFLLNGMTIWIGSTKGFTQREIWGYLSASNSLLVAVPATRNSLLNWLLNIPFDRTLLFHRWLGRLVITQTLVHALCTIPEQPNLGEWSNIFGIVGIICASIIGCTSIEYVRRKYFSVFLYSHYTFLLFYVFSSLHSSYFFKYACVAAGIYGIDRLIRFIRGIFPYAILEKEKIANQIIRIRFAKQHCVRYKVGQYVFLNFPNVSLTEWHPFTLSNAPGEPYNEIFIKGIGDHTTQLIAQFDKLKHVRIDGPYGSWPFDYNRYPYLLLICGGVGITPCLSLIRHLYHYNTTTQNVPNQENQIDSVYLIWCCKTEEETIPFYPFFIRAMEQTSPKFHLYIYITTVRRRVDLNNQTFYLGYPNYNLVFDRIESKMRMDHYSRACIFACGPKALIQNTWDMCSEKTLTHRYDFHHEIFDF